MPRGWWASLVITTLLSCQPLLAQRASAPTPQAAARQPLALRAALQQALAPAGIDVPDQSRLDRRVRTQELRITWESETADGLPVAPAAGFRVVRRVRHSSPFPRPRAFELAEDTLLFAAVDAAGALRGWSLIPDPRILRAEVPGPDGLLTGQVLRVRQSEFLAPIPDDPAVVEVRVLETRRAAGGLQLELVATLGVPADTRRER